MERKAFLALQSAGDLRVNTVLSLDETEQVQSAAFPDATNLNFWKILQDGLKGNYSKVDLRSIPVELLYPSEEQAIALEMMDRIDPSKSLSYLNRCRLYKYLVAFWVAYLHRNTVTHFYTRVSPHEVADYVLYVLCKALGIQIVTFNYTALPGCWIMADDFKLPWHRMDQSLRQTQQLKESDIYLTSDTAAMFRRIRSDYETAMPVYTKEALSLQRQNEWPAKSLARSKLLRPLKACLKDFWVQMRRKDLSLVDREEERRKEASANAAISEFESLSSYYEERASTELPSGPFVYFLLHFQPENTTVPLGGIFSDQAIAISILAAAVPSSWTIVVKEHPGQYFKIGHYGYLGRDRRHYDEIASIPNVQLASLQSDHFSLLDAASCVSTITGTVGWEALVRGKAVIVFGEAWYQQAPNCYRVGEVSECVSALQRIQRGTTVSQTDLKRFAFAIERCATRIFFVQDEARWAGSEFSEESSANTLIEALRSQHELEGPPQDAGKGPYRSNENRKNSN